MRYQAVQRLQGEYPVRRLCRTLGAAPSGYYRWRKREETDRVREDRRLKQTILAIHAQTKGRYGTPRVERALRRVDPIPGCCITRIAARSMRARITKSWSSPVEFERLTTLQEAA